MGAQVVHHHDLSRVQTGEQELFDVDFKGSSIGRSFQDHGSSHALERERGDQCRILAAIARHTAFSALSFRGSCIEGREPGIRTALIHKDELNISLTPPYAPAPKREPAKSTERKSTPLNSTPHITPLPLFP